MASRGFFGPSERALEFGAKYAEVLNNWGDLFVVASRLVESNVALGRMTADASAEFEKWTQETANAPWNWLNPELMQHFMQSMTPGTTPPKTP